MRPDARFGRELEVARRAAERSAGLALRHQVAGVKAESKADFSPVTQADRECEKLIAALLTDAFPDDGLLGEEGASRESKSGRRWIIDPIDGTRDYVRGLPLWSVLIALEADDEIQAGVIHLPILGHTCWAARGCGAFRDDVPIRVSNVTDPAAAVLTVNSLNRISEMPFSRSLIDWASKFWAYRCLGGTPDAMLLAAGNVDVWIEPKVAPWDLAAAQIILEEAGAVFFDFTGTRTIYGGTAVACTPGLEAELRAFFAQAQALHNQAAS